MAPTCYEAQVSKLDSCSGLLMTALVVIFLLPSFFTVIPKASGISGRAVENIVINEVLYDPIGNDVSGEFVELYNPTGTSIDMDHWSLTDRDGPGPDIVFGSLSVPSRGFLVVFTGKGVNETNTTNKVSHIYIGRNEGIWSNTGDDVLLSDDTGHPIDYMSYGTGISVDPPPDNIPWNGTVHLVPEGYSLGRLPDGNGTSYPSSYYPLMPTPGLANKPDPEPVISSWDLEPKFPKAFEDLSVWANASDGVRLDKVMVRTKGTDGIQKDQNMTWDQAQSHYKATVNGRDGGQTLELWIIATDPLGQSTVSGHQNITFKINASTQLIATIIGPEGTVLPGAVFHVQGHVLWLNGSKVSGKVTATNLETNGSWNTIFNDYFDVPLVAPTMEGVYDIVVQVRSGEGLISQRLSMEVRWPYKTLKCTLTADKSSGSAFMTGQTIFLNGTVRFSDGLPASRAQARLLIHNTEKILDLKANDQGNLRIMVRTPSVSGTYDVELQAQALGKSTNATLRLTVVDHLYLNLSNLPKLFDTKGVNLTISGRVTHHDGTLASNGLIVIEFMNTSHKVRAFTDTGGNFSVDMVAPYYSGQYVLRITVTIGDTYVQRQIDLLVGDKSGSSNPTPAWDSAAVLLGFLAALCLLRRR